MSLPQNTEKYYLVCLLTVWLFSLGLMSKFQLLGILEIQNHDTYFIFGNDQLIVYTAIELTVAYVLSYALSNIAAINIALKYTSLTVLVLLCLGMLLLFVYVYFLSLYVNHGSVYAISGLLTIIMGIAGLFLARFVEIYRKTVSN